MRPSLLVAGLALLLAGGDGPARAAAMSGVSVDWRAGQVRAIGVAAGNPRAPGPDVSRASAERLAAERAAPLLAEAAADLPLAGGGTVGVAAKADEAVAARVQRALAQARVVQVDYTSDGGARVVLALPIEALRVAIEPPAPPAAVDGSPTAIIVDATSVKLKPAVGVRVGGYAGPTVWHVDGAEAAADPRLGGRRVQAKATGYSKGTLALEVDGDIIAAAASAGALVVIVYKGGKS